MADYRIVCTIHGQVNGHKHITQVGTGTDPNQSSKLWTVPQVLADVDNFYTQSGSETARISGYHCECGYETLRTHPDDTVKDNLDDMRECRTGA
jgi:hypothetical protein